MRLWLPLSIAYVLVTGVAVGDWSDYRSSTLVEIESEHRTCNDPPVDFHLEVGSWKYSVRAISTGKSRAISPETRIFVERWAKGLGHGPETIALFTHEVEVRGAGASHWLPIQASLIALFESEIKAGDTVEFQIMLVGAAGARWMFFVNGFQKLAAAAV